MGHKEQKQAMVVGTLVVIAAALMVGGILIIGQEARLFAPKISYVTNFPDAAGLRVGSPVTMSGVRVGTVERIQLPTNPRSEGITFKISVDRDFSERVRRGTMAQLVLMQIVANERAVDLTPGDPNQPPLKEGDFIPPSVEKPILETGRTIADTLVEVTAQLREMLDAIRNGEGLIGRAIFDPNFGKQEFDHVAQVLVSLNELLSRVENGQGLMARMLNDQILAEKLTQDVTQAAANLAETTEKMKAENGLIEQLTNPERGKQVMDDLQTVVGNLRQVSEKLLRGEGVAGALLKDQESARRIVQNLDEALTRLNSIARKIDEGQGTLGQLVNDRTLHDEITATVAGVRKSKLAMGLFRHYNRRGEKALDKTSPPVPPAGAPDDPAGKPLPEGSYSTPPAVGSQPEPAAGEDVR